MPEDIVYIFFKFLLFHQCSKLATGYGNRVSRCVPCRTREIARDDMQYIVIRSNIYIYNKPYCTGIC